MKDEKRKSHKISENYSLSKDRVQWILAEHYNAKDKDGNDVIKTRDTYHSNLQQVANHMVDNNEHHCLDSYIEKADQIKNDIAACISVVEKEVAEC